MTGQFSGTHLAGARGLGRGNARNQVRRGMPIGNGGDDGAEGLGAAPPSDAAPPASNGGPPNPRGGAVEGRLVRRRPRTEDKFFIPPSIVPLGWCYEWKRESCYGQPDTDHQVNLRENHWTPVPAERHPQMMPLDFKGPIRKDGMVLMERPQYLTDEARQEDYEFATGEVQRATATLGQTPGGQFTRDHPSVHKIAKVKHSYGPIDAES